MAERGELERECATFCRYLGAPMGEYVLAKYVAAHAAGVVELPDTSRFARAVVALARGAPWLVRALDAHERVFANGGLLRRKLVLLLAILESRSPPAEALDAPTPGSTAGMFAHMAWFAARFAFSVLVAALLLLPLRVACAFGGAR